MPFAFDLDEYLGTLDPPRFTAGGRTYVGRLWSYEEFLAMEPHLKCIAEIPADFGVWKRHVRTVINAMFPPPSWWRRRVRGERSVADLVLAQPLPVVQTVVMGFVSAQAMSQTRLVRELAPAMSPDDFPPPSSSGSSSPPTDMPPTTTPPATEHAMA